MGSALYERAKGAHPLGAAHPDAEHKLPPNEQTPNPSGRKSLLPDAPPPALAPLTSSELEQLQLQRENTTGVFGRDSQVQSAAKDIEEKAVYELVSHRGEEKSRDLKNSAASLFEDQQPYRDSSRALPRPQQVSRLKLDRGMAEEGFLLDSSLREDNCPNKEP